MSVTLALHALLVIAGLAVSRALFRSPAAPFGVMCAIWFTALGLLRMNPLNYYPIRSETTVVLWLTLGLFLFGSIAAWLLSGMARSGGHVDLDPRHLRITFWICLVLGTIGTALYAKRVNDLLGIEMLWTNPMAVRHEEVYGELRSVGLTGLLRGLMIPTVVLGIMYTQIHRARRKFFIAGGALFALATLSPSSGRTVMLTTLFWAVFAAIYTRMVTRHEPMSQVRRVAMVALLILTPAVYFMKTSQAQEKTLATKETSAQTGADRLQARLADPYHYAIGPLAAFQVLLKDPRPFESRASLTFGAVSRVLHGIAPKRFAYPEYIQPFVDIPLPMNVYTYLDAFYVDFGWTGLLVLPALTGFVCSVVYLSMLRRPTWIKVFTASLLALCVVSTINVNRFGNLQTWFWIAAIAAIHIGVQMIIPPERSAFVARGNGQR